ncbi:uncharacterized protein NECHADRAFT_104286 [Fusarium vanettenii 77-13-4]|uniref:WSC domain-containing protein n=1 Tax=Fusarium vanettenii (strain ATCC MYA-4622 / CBS 123669 / FGSC 9596 / NRRL 45880 / 77-13-4) TaxID=660122 RepID=C7Z867_FUSV7|nr:uncharacterized protein NECHADRAFT_104286 [Fusarium vanettenii 77-13-4]EEU39945.1 hypothetical protein NECHADRAFT_104286 [Fusarium vanettenii 77-13-4]
MRFSLALLGAIAPSVLAQGVRFTNTSTPAVTTTEATSSNPTSTDAPLTLSRLDIPPLISCSLLIPPPFGFASFGVSGGLPFGINIGDLIRILFDILVALLDSLSKRADDTGCTLDVRVNGASVYNEALLLNGGNYQSLQSGDSQAGADAPELEFIQSCGANPVALTVANVAVGANGASNTGGAYRPTALGPPVLRLTVLNPPVLRLTVLNPPAPRPMALLLTDGAATGTETDGSATGTETDGSGTATGTETDATTTASSVPGFPPTVNGFVFFGCTGSSAGFPTFVLGLSSPQMDIDLCSSTCQGSNYFGVYDTDCYCGEEIDEDNTDIVSSDQCDIECPGDDSQNCGGDAPATRRSRIQARQNVPNSIRLTVYISAEFAGPGTSIFVTDVITATVTDQMTLTTTFVTTLTGPATTQTATVTAIYECFNGRCFPQDGGFNLPGGSGGRIVYVFKPYPGEDCDGQTVYIPESCNCKGGSHYVPIICTSDACHGKTVYKPEQTKHIGGGDIVFTPVDCHVCKDGNVIYKPWEDDYDIIGAPGCTGSSCPPTWTPGHGSSAPGGGSSAPGGGSSSHGGSDCATGTKGSGSDSTGGETSGEADGTKPVTVSGAGKQAVSIIAVLASIFAAAL